MLRSLSFTNWNNAELEGLDYVNFLRKKRSTLFSQLCLLATLATIIQGAYDLYEGFPYVMAIDVGFGFILFMGHLLNHKGKYHLATIIIFSVSSLMLFGFSSVVPKGVGIYLYFFPLITFSFISYDYQHRVYSFGFTFLSILLNGLLILTNFQPFGEINLQPADPTISFALNMLFSMVLLSLGINFLIKLNFRWEQVLLKQQKETERLSKEVFKKNISLEKTNQELDQFVYSTSHDLRAPLTSILGLVNLANMEKEGIPKIQKEYLEMIKDRVNSLDDFIKDIIDYSRNSRVDVVKSSVDVKKLIEEVLLNNRFHANRDKVDITTSIQLESSVQLDKNRVFRVINNLLSNAIKYCDLDKPNPFIRIEALIEKNCLVIMITDNGIGIEQECQEKIFDMFYRGTEKADGSGLGLYIAKEMTLKMNGLLEFKSSPGSNTTFTVSLPLT